MTDSPAREPLALEQVRLMARYNRWMNERVLAAAARLPAAEHLRVRGAFFGSILGTLNHLLVGDTIWLQRFADHPARHAELDPVRAAPMPATLDQMLHDDLAALIEHRRSLDLTIESWTLALSPADLEIWLEYRNTLGIASRRPFHALLMHFFNHQTHHRGQASALLTQAGADVGVTDLLALIPDEFPVTRIAATR